MNNYNYNFCKDSKDNNNNLNRIEDLKKGTQLKQQFYNQILKENEFRNKRKYYKFTKRLQNKNHISLISILYSIKIEVFLLGIGVLSIYFICKKLKIKKHFTELNNKEYIKYCSSTYNKKNFTDDYIKREIQKDLIYLDKYYK